jgi:hypothetical protein
MTGSQKVHPSAFLRFNMDVLPAITYFLPSHSGYTEMDATVRGLPLRLARSARTEQPGRIVTYGAYFDAIHKVLSKNGFEGLLDATGRQLADKIRLEDVRQIRVYGEKHGSDYHPARIAVETDKGTAVFVMNVAATDRGRNRLGREFESLNCLNQKYDLPYLPRVYLRGEVQGNGQANQAGEGLFVMFLADWFQGYHEFHLAMDDEAGKPKKLVLWDTETGHRFLSPKETMQTYMEAARILTLYYDLQTFEQIFPWHHAAGDFVARADGGAVRLRLITARQYAPMIEPGNGISPEDALHFFLLNLSLRMRLDRLDGVGDVIWADAGCVDASLSGFAEGLRAQERKGIIAPGTAGAFFRYSGSLDKPSVEERFVALVEACDPRAPDLPVIKRHLAGHVTEFFTAIRKIAARP